ncbi:MAG: DNA polymerase III subunit delta [Acidimicrobiales bacterium]
MIGSSVAVVGADPTMVDDEVRLAIGEALDGRDPAFALEDLSAGSGDGDAGAIIARIMDALATPPLLSDRRVVVVRDAQALGAEESRPLIEWLAAPTTTATLVLGVVGARSHRLVGAVADVRHVAVGTRPAERVAFVTDTFARHGLRVERSVAQSVAERIGDDVARADALARTLASIYGTATVSAAQIQPYLGAAGDVPEWDLTDAIDAGDVRRAVMVARRMLDSRSRVGVQIIGSLSRHFLRMARVEGAGLTSDAQAADLLGVKPYPAGKALRQAERLGGERLRASVHLIARADLDLKGAVSYGGRDAEGDRDPTELTVIEVLVARLATLARAARR